MKRAVAVPLVVLLAAGAAYGGYWFAHHYSPALSPATTADTHSSAHGESLKPAERRILYYKDPMGKPDFSPVPKEDEMGKDYIPVYEDEEESFEPAAAPQADRANGTRQEREVLYYRNPMGLPDTSLVPKKDQMGMDYIPVYADEAEDDGKVVRISPARVQMLGVRTESVTLQTLMRPVRAVGTVQFSERQIAVVSTKFEGWIETLLVNATGEPVRRGETLMRVYSPLLVQTQQEYLDAAKMAASLGEADADSRTAASRLVEGALQRLRYLDFPETELRRLERERRASRTVAWPAPFSGIVLEKMVFEGMRFMPGEPLFKIAGISPIWVIAEVFEQDMAHVAVGQPATITVKAYPGRSFRGRVAFIYPTVGPETRTGTVRIEIANPQGELKADMYASVELDAHATATKALTVPDSAVIDNGVRQVVLIERGEGRFEPRPVEVGAKADGFTEILAGVKADDRVVVSANFLIDAESNLKAALGAFTAGEHQHQ
ncbi:efflux RND transporter periplasmic adaptor subunit [Accumulibacter sp.]|uniref:efflux RND transporter periplasmic adaptor subunit n=1 Tax=Accumulibacter sp. TaxID=2053492 RepID=UPI0025D07F85|nr:efflux RND transporter periplasmic adaptor subunit [Accumulibacter sp.]MCM8627141.1 efflux RND transporter periplasmic adaptor subunit [Accumulibacter sp.]